MNKTYDLNLRSKNNSGDFSPGRALNAEKIIRLNPLWTVLSLELQENSFAAEIQNYATAETFQLEGEFRQVAQSGFTIHFSGGDCSSISIKSAGEIFQADVTYRNAGFVEESDEERFTVLWLRAIQEYMRLFQKNSLYNRFFRLIMDRVVLKMNPSQRKISLMLIRITIVEIAVILLIVIGYVFFVLKPSGGA